MYTLLQFQFSSVRIRIIFREGRIRIGVNSTRIPNPVNLDVLVPCEHSTYASGGWALPAASPARPSVSSPPSHYQYITLSILRTITYLASFWWICKKKFKRACVFWPDRTDLLIGLDILYTPPGLLRADWSIEAYCSRTLCQVFIAASLPAFYTLFFGFWDPQELLHFSVILKSDRIFHVFLYGFF